MPDNKRPMDLDDILEAAGLVGQQQDSTLNREAAAAVGGGPGAIDTEAAGLIRAEELPGAESAQGYTADEEALAELAASRGMEYIRLSDYDVDPLLVNAIDGNIARNYGVFPVSREGGVLTLALVDPLDVRVLDDLQLLLGHEVRGAVAREDEIRKLIDDYYAADRDDFDTILQKMEEGDLALEISADAFDNEESLASQPPVIRLVNLLLLQAIQQRASDLHIEPFEKSFRIRYRVDGSLHETIPPPRQLQNAIISRLKVMANMDIAERRVPQDGRIKLNFHNRDIDLRVSSLPTVNGESIVMRILDQSSMGLTLQDVGLSGPALEILEEVIIKPNGILLVTGPTGSGKTTTLYAALNRIFSDELKIITAENPVEYQIKGIVQCDVNPEVGLSFARVLRSMLRQDPDIIMVGEIRDAETAKMAIESSLTGHLVLSTLHTNDAPSAVTRLVDMGVEPFLITSAVEAVLAQRLVRKICPACKTQYDPEPQELRDMGQDESVRSDVTFYHGVGCERCGFAKYHKRTGIFEIFRFNDELREMVLNHCSSTELFTAALSFGMVALKQDGWRKICAGATTIEEVLRETF